MRTHPFPGNVRELENLTRRLVLTASDMVITAEEMSEALSYQATLRPALQASIQNPAPVDRANAGTAGLSDVVEAHLQRYFDLHGDSLPPPGLYDRILREIERPLLQVAMDATGGNQLRCADLLGINRNTLRKKLTDLKIEVTRRRKLM